MLPMILLANVVMWFCMRLAGSFVLWWISQYVSVCMVRPECDLLYFINESSLDRRVQREIIITQMQLNNRPPAARRPPAANSSHRPPTPRIPHTAAGHHPLVRDLLLVHDDRRRQRGRPRRRRLCPLLLGRPQAHGRHRVVVALDGLRDADLLGRRRAAAQRLRRRPRRRFC